MASSKTWNRRLALAGGVALAAGAGAMALSSRRRHIHRTLVGPDTLLRGNAGEPETLDPSLASDQPDAEIIGDLMVGLFMPDPAARPYPAMATSWTTSADGLTWIFHLRDARWSDNTPITAQDFVFSWQRLVTPATASTYAYYLYPVKNAEPINAGKMAPETLGVRALDDHTLEVHLENPAPYFPQMLMHQTTSPLPRHVVKAKGAGWAQPGSYVGNGAFVLKEWVPNDHVLVEKNPLFYEADKVRLRQVYFFPTNDYGAALQRFRAGELDTQDKLPGQEIDWIRANIPQTISNKPQLVTEIVAVNHRRKPFDDIRVREAINLAINREALTDRIKRVGDVPAYNLVPPTTANYPTGNSFDFKHLNQRQRLDKACALMRAVGFGENNRCKTTFLIRSTTAGSERAIAAAIQQMLAQIWLDIAIIPNDFQIFYPTIQVHDFDIAQSGWQADFNDAITFLNLLRSDSGDNWGLYNSPAYDAMLAGAQAEINLESRGQKLAAAERIALADQALMPLWFWNDSNLAWPYLSGWEANPLDYHRSRWVSIDQRARITLFA
ncbi:MAG TPA: peptide ABC transporter substrate-binding protein [Rhizomicrobium sp.]|jgi:oligopeptide transport system substrate-binding protein